MTFPQSFRQQSEYLRQDAWAAGAWWGKQSDGGLRAFSDHSAFYGPGTLSMFYSSNVQSCLQLLSPAHAAPLLECMFPGSWPNGLILNLQASTKLPHLQKGPFRHPHLKWPPWSLFLTPLFIPFIAFSIIHNCLLACICLINNNKKVSRGQGLVLFNHQFQYSS